MKRIIGLVFVAASCLFAAPESVERARELERGGQALDARAAFAQAVAEAPSDPETLLAYAECASFVRWRLGGGARSLTASSTSIKAIGFG